MLTTHRFTNKVKMLVVKIYVILIKYLECIFLFFYFNTICRSFSSRDIIRALSRICGYKCTIKYLQKKFNSLTFRYAKAW